MKAGLGWEVWLSDFAKAQITPSNDDLQFNVRPKTVESYLSQRVRAGWTLHDLRRTAASRMAQMGTPPHVVSACLAHAIGSMADQHYMHGALYQDERRAALKAWGEWLSGQVENQEDENVSTKDERVTFPRAFRAAEQCCRLEPHP